MKVYAVVIETDEYSELNYQIVGIYKNEDDANDKLADIMQDIWVDVCYVKEFDLL